MRLTSTTKINQTYSSCMKALMGKAKTSEWVKLIDCDYENEVKVWLRSIQISIMKWSLKKGQGLESRFLVRKHEDVCTTLMSNLKGKCVKRF